MATGARGGGWTLHVDARTSIWFVRFRHAGKRWHRSTGTTDRREAQRVAAKIYEEVTSGRIMRLGGKSPPLDELLGGWLEAFEATHAAPTAEEYVRYARRHFLPTFRSLANITEASAADYMRERLRNVKAETVKKELSALRSFLEWCVERGILPEAPTIPRVPRRATGTPNETRAQMRVDLTAEQVEAIIANLPERGRAPRGRRGDDGYPIRDVFALLWETGLRIRTIQSLRVPEHFRHGASTLAISADIDKARFARELPVSRRALAILNRHARKDGLIFGPYDFRGALYRASLDLGLREDMARKVGPHDVRHAVLTHLASSSANVAGIAYLAGHKHLATTARYVHAAKSAGEDALRARRRNGTPNGTRSTKRVQSAKGQE
jgi:integrase